MRILVCGGRDFYDIDCMYHHLDEIHHKNKVTCVIQGEAHGADLLAKRWADESELNVMSFPADWEKHGRAAGPIRNKQMLDEGRPDLVVAFPGGRGTQNMINQARKAGIEVLEIKYNG